MAEGCPGQVDTVVGCRVPRSALSGSCRRGREDAISLLISANEPCREVSAQNDGLICARYILVAGSIGCRSFNPVRPTSTPLTCAAALRRRRRGRWPATPVAVLYGYRHSSSPERTIECARMVRLRCSCSAMGQRREIIVYLKMVQFQTAATAASCVSCHG